MTRATSALFLFLFFFEETGLLRSISWLPPRLDYPALSLLPPPLAGGVYDTPVIKKPKGNHF